MIDLSTLVKWSGQNIILPFYHTVSNERLPHIANLYSVKNVKFFVKDLDFFCKHYLPISLEELQHINLSHSRVSKPSFHLTFDDGLSEMYHIVAPILEAKGIPATFFINSAFVDNQDIFYRYKVSLIIDTVNSSNVSLKALLDTIGSRATSKETLVKELKTYNFNQETLIDAIAELLEVDFGGYLSATKPYLTKEQIDQLITRGFSIGAHSVSHPNYKDIPDAARKWQTEECFRSLIQNFNIHPSSFSFPFGDEDVPLSFFKWLYETQACTTSFGVSGLKHDVYKNHLHRIPMEKSLQDAETIIKKEYWYYLAKQLLNKNKIGRND